MERILKTLIMSFEKHTYNTVIDPIIIKRMCCLYTATVTTEYEEVEDYFLIKVYAAT